jgi:hypothetical protein
MGKAITSLLFHTLRVVLAALAMLVIAFCLWLLIGLTSSVLGIQTPALIMISAVAIAVVACAVGGYVSSRYITARSLFHPAAAAVALGAAYAAFFTRGDIGGLTLLLPFAAGIVACGGAVVARSGHAA